jgi:Outer membrane efflux protein
VKAAETALLGIREQWALGDRTMREVLDAEQEFLTAEVNLIVAERDRIVASYAIAKELGKLTLASLEPLPLTAARDAVFAARRMEASFAPAKRTGKRACKQDCRAFAEGWAVRLMRQ